LAALCGTTAVTTHLVRTRIGNFQLSESVPLDQLSGSSLECHLQPLHRATSHLPLLHLTPSQIELLTNGIKLSTDGCPSGFEHVIDEAAVLDAQSDLRAIVQRRGAHWCPYRVFPKSTKS
jgi:tRNA pseudouridine55 synthase